MTGKAAIIGGGVIGGGWAARFLLNGWTVAIFDPDPDAARKIDAVLINARTSMPSLYDRPLPPEGALTYAASLDDAVSGADWVQESTPERLDMKRGVLAQITAAAPETAIVASSTSGFKPSDLNAEGGRSIVAHPFNPVYLLPLVELVGASETCARAADILEGLGMFPLTLRQEVDAHIADRLLEAVWRESLWLVHDGIATTEQIDAAIRMGFGLRWAQMGLFETYRIAGGEAGMAHFLAQFGPALAWPWTKLTDVPDLSDAFVAKIAAQSDAQSGHMSIRELERKRDENLVGLLRALKQSKAGAGQVLLDHEARLPAVGPSDAPWVTLSVQVPSSWTDYNGHMNESHYLEAGSKATDCVLDRIGAGPDYVAGGFSYFTVESHVQHLAEIHAGDRLTAESQILAAEGKRLHLFHTLRNGTGAAVATHETLLVHVDLTSRRACVPLASVAARVATLAQDHMARPRPAGAGRAVGQRP